MSSLQACFARWRLLFLFASSLADPCSQLWSAVFESELDPEADAKLAASFAALAPGLHIGKRAASNFTGHIDHKFEAASFRLSARAAMLKYGYAELTGFFLQNLDVLQLVSQAIENLEECGFHQNFVLLYDEVWELAHAANSTLGAIYGLNSNMDFFLFNVKPGDDSWPGHRDRPMRAEFQSDGMPKYTTVWMAITDADPENTSCIFAVPAYSDSAYTTPEVEPTEDEQQGANPLPVKAGTVLVWSDRLFHWGSTSPANSTFARRTLTMAMSMPEYEQPHLKVAENELPSLEARLALVAYQAMAYSPLEPLSIEDQVRFFRWVVRYKKFLFDEWYESIENKISLSKAKRFEL